MDVTIDSSSLPLEEVNGMNINHKCFGLCFYCIYVVVIVVVVAVVECIQKKVFVFFIQVNKS